MGQVVKELREHSLSIALFVGFVLANAAFFQCEPGHWYDFFNMVAGSFAGGFVIVVLGKPFYERGSDPTKPPEECE